MTTVPHFPPLDREVRAPQAKLRGKRRHRATWDVRSLPVYHHRIPADVYQDPRFAPPPPLRGFWLHDELPRRKLRGLGPADSLILRHAIARGLINPQHFYLAPLVPWRTPPAGPEGAAWGQDPDSRDLLNCPDAPMQPDGVTDNGNNRARSRTPGATDAQIYANLTPTPIEIIEIKPNAGYVAFGQVLAYAWAWNQLFQDKFPATPTILTDLPRPYLTPLALAYGVNVYQLGALLLEPPPWPT